MLKTDSKGVSLILISAFFFGTYGIWSKLMSNSFGAYSQAWTRALIILAFLIPFGLMRKEFSKIEKKDFVWFAAMALCGGLNQAPYFYGFEHLSIGTATLLFYTALTVGAFIIGKLFFGEILTRVKYVSLFLAVLGMSFIYHFSLTSSQILPALSTIIAGLMGAGSIIFSKKLSDTYSETQILTSHFVVMIIGNGLLSILFTHPVPDLALTNPWLGQLGYCVTMILANAAAILGFKYIKEPSLGGLIGLMEIIFGVIFGILFFNEIISTSLFIGALIILIAMALPDAVKILRKITLNKPSNFN